MPIPEGNASRIIRWTLFGLLVLSWILTVVTLADCRFIVEERKSFYVVTYGGDPERRSGLFSDEDSSGYCEKNEDIGDSSEKWAAAFGVLACLAVSANLVIFLLHVFVLRKMVLWLVLRIMFILAPIFSAFTFLKVKHYNEKLDDYDPSITGWWLGSTGILTCINIVLLLVLAILSFLVGPLKKEGEQGMQTMNAQQQEGAKHPAIEESKA